jgi:succinoglycan biosynthesis transport protein ExoP
VTEQMTSRASLEAIINRYGLYRPVTRMDVAVQQMQNDVKLDTKFRSDNQGFPDAFVISYRHVDPAIARQVVTDLVAIFDQANSQLERQAVEEARKIRAEINEIESRLSNISDTRTASAIRRGAASRAAAASNAARAERLTINSNLEQLQDRRFALQQQIGNQKQQIVRQQELVRAAPSDESRASGALGALLRRKSDLEAKVRDYAGQFTERHPKLLDAQEQLADVNRRIGELSSTGAQDRAAASSPEATELRNLQRELARMETELEVVDREIGRKQNSASSIPAGASTSSAPAAAVSAGDATGRDYQFDGLRERYSALLKREDDIRQFQPSTSGPATKFFQMVDAPNLPQSPVAPNRMKLMGFALALALVAGLGAVALGEVRRIAVIHDERDVTHFLGVPTVAVIPETFTEAERGRARQLAFKRRAIFLALGAAAIPALVLLLNTLEIFQILGMK